MKTARLLLLIILLSFVDNKVAAQCAENIRMYELGMQLFEEFQRFYWNQATQQSQNDIKSTLI